MILPARLAHTLILVAGAILILGQNPRLAPLLRPVYPARAWIAWAGVVVCVAGLAFAVWARVQIGRLWSGSVALKAEHTLVRGGPYAITRHPIYSGLLLARHRDHARYPGRLPRTAARVCGLLREGEAGRAAPARALRAGVRELQGGGAGAHPAPPTDLS